MSEEARNAMQISNPVSQQLPFIMIAGGSTLGSGSIPLQTGGRPGASQQRMLEMMDEK